MGIQITEHKSMLTINPLNAPVRVFVDRDFHYGYFIPEHRLFELLSDEQKNNYLNDDTPVLDVTAEIAQKIIDMGCTPYSKA